MATWHKIRNKSHFVRARPISAALSSLFALLFAACVDAPITPAHLSPDGQLRSADQLSSFSRKPAAARRAVAITAVLAAQPDGALVDATEFSTTVGTVHLHLRADGLIEPHPVTFVWSHADITVEIPGTLAPSETLSLAASHPIRPEDAGRWRVSVVGQPNADEPTPMLFEREFLVRRH